MLFSLSFLFVSVKPLSPTTIRFSTVSFIFLCVSFVVLCFLSIVFRSVCSVLHVCQ